MCFGLLEDIPAHGVDLFRRHNAEQRHSSLRLHTSTEVCHGLAAARNIVHREARV